MALFASAVLARLYAWRALANLSPNPARPTGDPNDARLLTFGVYGVTLEIAP